MAVEAPVRRILVLLLVLPFVMLGAPAAQAQTCEIVPETLADGNVGTEGTWFITVTGCSSTQKLPSFKVVDGGLPTGTKLSTFASSTGLIFGTPKAEGTFTFTIQVKDETRATDTETFSITIQPPPPLVISTEALSDGTVGDFYCCGNLFASGGVPGYTWSVVSGELPPGLELPKRENTISGTPTTAGAFTFTVRVTDERDATAEKALTITIS
jgi:Putative Ig domain